MPQMGPINKCSLFHLQTRGTYLTERIHAHIFVNKSPHRSTSSASTVDIDNKNEISPAKATNSSSLVNGYFPRLLQDCHENLPTIPRPTTNSSTQRTWLPVVEIRFSSSRLEMFGQRTGGACALVSQGETNKRKGDETHLLLNAIPRRLGNEAQTSPFEHTLSMLPGMLLSLCSRSESRKRRDARIGRQSDVSLEDGGYGGGGRKESGKKEGTSGRRNICRT